MRSAERVLHRLGRIRVRKDEAQVATCARGRLSALGRLGDGLLCLTRQPRWRDVERLLEIRSVERVGFVEKRQGGQHALDQEPLQGDFETWDELFDQQLMGARIVSIKRSVA